MAKEVEERAGGGGLPPTQRPPAPPEAPEKRGAGWLPWVGGVVLIGLVVGLVVLMAGHRDHSTPPPVNGGGVPESTTSPSASVAPSLPAAVPATTYQAFASLPLAQQKAVMTAAIDRYDAVLNQAYETLDDSLLPLVATGDELPLAEQKMATLRTDGYGLKEVDQDTVLQVLLAPSPSNVVTVQLQSTSFGQYVNPSSLQPLSSAGAPVASTTLFTFVIQDGTWKVSEHIATTS